MNRWGVRRTPQGGVSIGWTSIVAFRECARRAYWSKLYGGHGLTTPDESTPNEAMLYGQLWHRAYRSSWRGENILESLREHIAGEGLRAEVYEELCAEVLRDVDWYWSQHRGDETTYQVLACEDELRVQFGRHELRGTPDLVARTESGTVVIPDHKTYGVLSFPKGNARIELEPRERTIQGYQTSRQFAFYMMLWNTFHPEAACYDAMLNLVPSHVTRVVDILSSRKGNVAQPKVSRLYLEPVPPNYLEELREQTLELCDRIAEYWDAEAVSVNPDKLFLDALTYYFPENPDACSSYYGKCRFYNLCTGDAQLREGLLSDVFVKREE